MNVTKRATLTCVLVGTLLVAFFVISFADRPQSSRRIRERIDDVVYYLRHGRKRVKFSQCVYNLERIYIAQENWAIQESKSTNDIPSWNDLRYCLAEQLINGIPVCPEGGTYKINRVGKKPTCSIGGLYHRLSSPSPPLRPYQNDAATNTVSLDSVSPK
jgi:hypothetical protein